jgi:hypothetical protein
MPTLEEQVRHDASSLYQFVSSITQYLETRNPAAAYLSSSERFFKYIIELGQATKAYLRNFPGGRTQTAQFLDLRDDIAVLRGSWQFLHLFVKPALDSDTLHLPTSLIQGLIERFRETPGYSDTDFAIFHTDVFNYLNVQLNVFKSIADKIAAPVGGPKFPEKLALIGIPYSQSSSVFMNCLIPHEMGHHVFGDKALDAKFRPLVEKELQQLFGTTLSTLDRSAITNILVRWAEELFCDVFAVRMVGFCYSIAFIELFDASKGLDSAGHLTRSAGMTEFDEYPPHLFRLKQQVIVLKKDAWWNELIAVPIHYVDLLKEVDAMKDTDFNLSRFGSIDTAKIKGAFLKVVPTIFSELETVTAGLESGLEEWKEVFPKIERYFEHGIVPSNLLEKPGELKFHTPSLTALLNSAYRFYVQSLDALLNHIQDADVGDVACRSDWATKVQTWTAKAIEDCNLLRARAKAKGPA